MSAEDAIEGNVLAVGRLPTWQTVSGSADAASPHTGAPSLATSGTDVRTGFGSAGSVKVPLVVALREDPSKRTFRIEITTTDLTATYTVTIDGNAVSYDANAASAADVDDIIEGLVAALNNAGGTGVTGNATVAATLTAQVDPDDSTKVLVEGDTESHYTIAVSTTGSGVQAVVADPSSCTMRLWVKWYSASTSPPWTQVNSGSKTLDYRGWSDRISTAGFSRLYVELDSLAGTGDGTSGITYDADVYVGPCGLES